MVLEDRPVMTACGKEPGEVYVATERRNVELWDMAKMEMIKSFPMPGAIANMAWNEDKSILYVASFTDSFSGVVLINAQKRKLEGMIIPPPIGIISCILPLESGSSIYALLARNGDGRLALLKKKEGRFIIERNQKTGSVPVSFARLKTRNRIIVTNNQGKNIASFEEDTFKPTFSQPVEGEPAQAVAGLRDGKAYVSIPDKDMIVVIDGSTGRQIEQIPVGKKPWAMKRVDSTLYVSNTLDRTISVIDCTTDKVEKTIPPEDFQLLRDLDIVRE
jgi:YVTN family beta-propeller protein